MILLSLILSIAGIVFAWGPAAIAGIPCAVIAYLLAGRALKKLARGESTFIRGSLVNSRRVERPGVARTARVLAVIGLVTGCLTLAYFLLFIGF